MEEWVGGGMGRWMKWWMVIGLIDCLIAYFTPGHT